MNLDAYVIDTGQDMENCSFCMAVHKSYKTTRFRAMHCFLCNRCASMEIDVEDYNPNLIALLENGFGSGMDLASLFWGAAHHARARRVISRYWPKWLICRAYTQPGGTTQKKSQIHAHYDHMWFWVLTCPLIITSSTYDIIETSHVWCLGNKSDPPQWWIQADLEKNFWRGGGAPKNILYHCI